MPRQRPLKPAAERIKTISASVRQDDIEPLEQFAREMRFESRSEMIGLLAVDAMRNGLPERLQRLAEARGVQ